jgi:hypothetical protein
MGQMDGTIDRWELGEAGVLARSWGDAIETEFDAAASAAARCKGSAGEDAAVGCSSQGEEWVRMPREEDDGRRTDGVPVGEH